MCGCICACMCMLAYGHGTGEIPANFELKTGEAHLKTKGDYLIHHIRKFVHFTSAVCCVLLLRLINCFVACNVGWMPLRARLFWDMLPFYFKNLWWGWRVTGFCGTREKNEQRYR